MLFWNYALIIPIALLLSAPVQGEVAWQRHCIDDSLEGADGVRLADINADGRLDIVTGWEEAGAIRLYLHPGRDSVKQPWPAVTVGRVDAPEDAVFADLNGDGRLEVVSCTEGNEQTVYIHWGPEHDEQLLDEAQWRTEAIEPTRGQTRWMFALPWPNPNAPGDDLIVGSKNPNAVVGLLRWPAQPSDLLWRPLFQASWIMSIRPVDMNQDGREDVLFSDRKGEMADVYYLPAAENGAVDQAAARRLLHIDHEYMFVDAGDVDGDGAVDIAAAARDAGIQLFLNPLNAAKGSLVGVALPMPHDSGTGKAAALGDLDGDGRTDIAATCEHAGGKHGVFYWAQSADGPAGDWQLRDIGGLAGTKFDRIELIDLDGDHDLDLLTCEESEGLGVIWYENPLN